MTINELKPDLPKVDQNFEVQEAPQPSSKFSETVDRVLNFKYAHADAIKTTAYQSVSEIKGLFSDPDDAEMDHTSHIAPPNRYVTDSFGKPQFLSADKKVSAADIGTATHLMLQKISLKKTPNAESFIDLRDKLVEQDVLKFEVAEKIDIASLVNFYQSDLGSTILKNNQSVMREYPFSVLLPASELFESEKDNGSSDDKVLVHGIIDGVIEQDDGIIVFDYKTDNVSDNNIQQKIHDYSGQLNLYAEAIALIKQKPIIGKYLYFLKINQVEKLD